MVASRYDSSPSAANACRISTGLCPLRCPAALLRRAWPLASSAQKCRIERTRERAGTISHEIAYAVTSLSPQRRDVVLREDQSTIRSGTSPRAVAAFRKSMLAIVHDSAEPLGEIRDIFAENRLKAVAAAQQGFL